MQAQEFIFEDDEDYRIPHRAPMHDSGSPLYDVTGTYPDDIYGPNGVQYYGTREPWDARSIRVIQLSRNKPNQTIQIFRAVPKEVKSNTINPGDWVTASKEYATQHGKGLGKYKLLSKIVPAKTLFTNGDSIHEWGYDPGGAAQPVAEDKMISNGQPVENITVYHGGKQPITKFNIPPYGVFFTPHKDWAEQYGTVVTAAKIQSPNVYIVSSDGKGFDNEVLDALFRRDYSSLTKIIKLLMSRGYTALQTQTDTEMLCVFPGTNIQIVDSSDDPVAENFADGKGPGRPGDSVRHGIPKNATMAELEKASRSAGRKGQLARWQLNMRRGKAELSEIKQRLDAKCWPGKRKEGTKIKGGIRVNNCVPVSETGVKKPQLKTYAARVKLKQSGYTNIVDATVMARNPEMARRLLHQLYGGNSSIVGQPREIK